MTNEGLIPDFSDSYHKAHKNYVLFSGLLLAWEFIGIEIPEIPFESFKMHLKSPEALPLVLIALLVYFSFRYTIEWFQSYLIRRKLFASKLDFWATHAIALISVGIYAYQSTSKTQIADSFKTGGSLWLVTCGVATYFVIIVFLANIGSKNKWNLSGKSLRKTALIAFAVSYPITSWLHLGEVIFSLPVFLSTLAAIFLATVMYPMTAGEGRAIEQLDQERNKKGGK